MANPGKNNLGESIRHRLRNLSKEMGRPFDEILRYYAIERFLYRLSISHHAKRFFLKGGLMLRVWDSMNHRPTLDIDLLAKISNQEEPLRRVITDIASISCEEDGIVFDVQELILRRTQNQGDYSGMRASFSAQIFKTKVPILIDIGFNDVIVPSAQQIEYPTLLGMEKPLLLGYSFETVIAEKLESIVKIGLVNTRMKDFYDLWRLLAANSISTEKLLKAVGEVFSHRKTELRYPTAFTPLFYESTENQQRWNSFLKSIGESSFELKDVIMEISQHLPFLPSSMEALGG